MIHIVENIISELQANLPQYNYADTMVVPGDPEELVLIHSTGGVSTQFPDGKIDEGVQFDIRSKKDEFTARTTASDIYDFLRSRENEITFANTIGTGEPSVRFSHIDCSQPPFYFGVNEASYHIYNFNVVFTYFSLATV